MILSDTSLQWIQWITNFMYMVITRLLCMVSQGCGAWCHKAVVMVSQGYNISYLLIITIIILIQFHNFLFTM